MIKFAGSVEEEAVKDCPKLSILVRKQLSVTKSDWSRGLWISLLQ